MLAPLLHFLLGLCRLARVKPRIAGEIYGAGRKRESGTGGLHDFQGTKSQVSRMARYSVSLVVSK